MDAAQALRNGRPLKLHGQEDVESALALCVDLAAIRADQPAGSVIPLPAGAPEGQSLQRSTREGLLGGGSMHLVTLRLFDGSDVVLSPHRRACAAATVDCLHDGHVLVTARSDSYGSAKRPPACHAGGRRFESGRSR